VKILMLAGTGLIGPAGVPGHISHIAFLVHVVAVDFMHQLSQCDRRPFSRVHLAYRNLLPLPIVAQRSHRDAAYGGPVRTHKQCPLGPLTFCDVLIRTFNTYWYSPPCRVYAPKLKIHFE
jgi:hypothetical protein